MVKIATIKSGNVVAQIEGVDDETRMRISNAMSYVVEGAAYMGSGGWDGRTTLFDWNTSKFPAGFVPSAAQILRKAGYDVRLLSKPLPGPLGELPTPDNPLVDVFPADDRYDYQFEAPKLLAKHGRFISRAATGAGKSRLARLCIKYIGRKTLFVTTRQVLLYQMGEALTESGFKVSYVGDGEWDTSGDVVLAMVQTLNDRLSEPKIDQFKHSHEEVEEKISTWKRKNQQALDLLGQIEFVIGEEAHEAGGNAYYTVLKNCKNACYRLALTATPMMRDGESNMRLIAAFGPIRQQISELMLIERGILAKPYFKYVDVPAPPTLKRSTNWQKAEDLAIINHTMRNKHIVAECKRAALWGMPALVLIKRQAHGKILLQMMRNNGLRAEFIYGDSNRDKRKLALTKLANGEIDVIIGSTIVDVGVDVPAVTLLVLGGGGKAEVATRQRIGRSLRAKKSGPNIAFIVDFKDPLNKHTIKHYKTRRAIVEQTPGFAENIVSGDFSFSALGFKRAKVAA